MASRSESSPGSSPRNGPEEIRDQETPAERTGVDEALRESEGLIRSVLDNLPMGVAVNSVDPAVAFRYMNDAFAKAYRVRREQLTHPDAFWEAAYQDPEARDAIRRRVLADCSSGVPERMHWEDIPITRRGEETTFISARNVPIPGSPVVISTVWDVTERKKAELRLRDAEERIRTLFDASPEAVLLIDPEGILLEINHAALVRYGYTRAELLDMRVAQLSTPSLRDKVEDRLADAARAETRFEWRHQRKDGTQFPVEILTKPIIWEARPCILASARDISERKEAEARIIQQLEELRRWHEATLGREGRILELKKEVNALLVGAGLPPRYPSATEADA